EETPFPAIPDGERKHPAQVLNAIRAIFLVEMNDRLCVAVRPITMAARLERAAQRGMVIDFAVEGDPDRAILIAQRLLAGFEIDDAQPAHRQANVGVEMRSALVRPAMHDLPVHCIEHGPFDGTPAIKLEDATDSAHLFSGPIPQFANFGDRRGRLCAIYARVPAESLCFRREDFFAFVSEAILNSCVPP